MTEPEISTFWRSRYTGGLVCIVWKYVDRRGIPMIRYQTVGGARSQNTAWVGYFTEHYVPAGAA